MTISFDSQMFEAAVATAITVHLKENPQMSTLVASGLSRLELTHYKVSSITAHVEVFRLTHELANQVSGKLQRTGHEDVQMGEPAFSPDLLARSR